VTGVDHYKSAEECLKLADSSPQPEATAYLLAAIAHGVLADVGLKAQRLGDAAHAEAWREALS
jgi:hypothetical protein